MTYKYVCAECDQEFSAMDDDEWNEAEAIKEMLFNFGNIPEHFRAIVCDDCYKKIIKSVN